MPLSLKINGEPGTPAYFARKNCENLERIASSLEEIAQCLKNNNPSSH